MPPAMPCTPNSQASNTSSIASRAYLIGPRVEPSEGGGDRVDRGRVEDRAPVAQGEQRLALGQLRRRPVGLREDAEGAELPLGELTDVLAADAPPFPFGDDGGDLLGVAAPVAGLRHRVQQRRELDHLAVAAAGQQRRLAEPGVLVLAEQLDAVGEDEDLRVRGWCRGGRDAGGGHVALRLSPGPRPARARTSITSASCEGSLRSTSSVLRISLTRASWASTAWWSWSIGGSSASSALQLAPDLPQLGAAGAGEPHRGVEDAHELTRLRHDLAAGALEVERDRLVGRGDLARALEAITIWNAIAVASQSVQRAAACALLASSTTPPRCVLTSHAKSNARPPSCSIVACAKFSWWAACAPPAGSAQARTVRRAAAQRRVVRVTAPSRPARWWTTGPWSRWRRPGASARSRSPGRRRRARSRRATGCSRSPRRRSARRC